MLKTSQISQNFSNQLDVLNFILGNLFHWLMLTQIFKTLWKKRRLEKAQSLSL